MHRLKILANICEHCAAMSNCKCLLKSPIRLFYLRVISKYFIYPFEIVHTVRRVFQIYENKFLKIINKIENIFKASLFSNYFIFYYLISKIINTNYIKYIQSLLFRNYMALYIHMYRVSPSRCFKPHLPVFLISLIRLLFMKYIYKFFYIQSKQLNY